MSLKIVDDDESFVDIGDEPDTSPISAAAEPKTWRLKEPTSRKVRSESTPARMVDSNDTIQDIARRGAAKTTGWGEADIDALQLLLASLLILVTGRVAAVAKEPDLRASEQEINAASEPLARIILRHVKIAKGKRGDIADVLAIAAAMVAYTIRTFDALDRKKLPVAKVINPPDQDNGAKPGWTMPGEVAVRVAP